ncbi:sigma-54 dependent transcriptional regulator [uncultured Psychrobacter sp.]|uniref:sigma-54-dependent transcriptional regulator n=1 Tax=uncultured Psychrobacter sp. TaxID=259303 RepID=UPI002603E9E9|nr:sigma-54 dependent transcriptional regulator [uncultured Psychrobacter sp.]
MTTTALVVDDEVDLCRLMQITLTKMGIKSDVAYTLSQAKAYWQENDYDFCLTDLKLPDGSGLELVKHISGSSTTPIAVITAHGSMDLAIEALKLGAFDFVNKPLELPRLRQLVESALKVIHQDNVSKSTPERSPEQQMLDSRLIGDSAVMHPLKNTILKFARSQAPVFLSGASGTGKEVVARLIHDLSPRRDGSFVPVNCGAIPSELMESEFFGHKKGSFTGAVADKQGLFQQANGGTLFLDEVADLPLAMQVKLLRAIQEKTVRAIGDTKEVPVDIRILSATHKDLNQLVQAGNFRQDLYYRINVIELKLPTLNARRDDIPVLAKHFLALIADEWQLESPPTLTDNACARLQDHDFAGNVRELRNVLERAVTLAETSTIDASHLGHVIN